jgi:hypothetical protein
VGSGLRWGRAVMARRRHRRRQRWPSPVQPPPRAASTWPVAACTLMSRLPLGQPRCRQLVSPRVGLLAARRSPAPRRASPTRPRSERPISLGRGHLRVRGHCCRGCRRWRAPPIVLRPMRGPRVQALTQTSNSAVRLNPLGLCRSRGQGPTRFHLLLGVQRLGRWGPRRFRVSCWRPPKPS